MELEAFLDCPVCGETITGTWPGDAASQEMTEAPVARQSCSAGHSWDAEYPKWSFYTEAG